MLVLRRSEQESIIIADVIEVKVIDIGKGKVKLGIEAPRDIPVHRKEVWLKIQKEKEASDGK